MNKPVENAIKNGLTSKVTFVKIFTFCRQDVNLLFQHFRAEFRRLLCSVKCHALNDDGMKSCFPQHFNFNQLFELPGVRRVISYISLT